LGEMPWVERGREVDVELAESREISRD
jgi:hypothetical protein